MRSIDADDLLGLIEIRQAWNTGYSVEDVIEDIKQSKTLNTTGEWIAVPKPRMGNPYRHYRCSRCGNPVPYIVNYCDYCGSRNVRG